MNVALRGKLTEEIKDNTVNVKVFLTSRKLLNFLAFKISIFFPAFTSDMFIGQTICLECIEVLAAVCETTSLATLTLYFPPQKVWQFEVVNVSEAGLAQRRKFRKKA